MILPSPSLPTSFQPTLGVDTSKEAKLFVLTGPVGAYYPTGFQPVSLLADSEYCRAYPGGVGAYKMGWYVFVVGDVVDILNNGYIF